MKHSNERKGRWRGKADEREERRNSLRKFRTLLICVTWGVKTHCDRHIPAQWCALNKLSSHQNTGMVARSCQSLPIWWPASEHGQEPRVRTGQTAWSSGELCQHPTVCTDHCLQTRWNFWFSPVAAFSRLLVRGNGIYQTVSDQSSLLQGRHWWLCLAFL